AGEVGGGVRPQQGAEGGENFGGEIELGPYDQEIEIKGIIYIYNPPDLAKVATGVEAPADKAPADKVPADKVPADKAPADKVPAKSDAEKTAAPEKTGAEKTGAEKTSTEKAGPEKTVAPSPKTP